jgi:hypothetical protein
MGMIEDGRAVRKGRRRKGRGRREGIVAGRGILE